MGSRKWINMGGNTIEIEMGRKRNFSRPPLSSPHPHDRISLSSPPSPRPPPHAASARSATGPRPWALRPSLLEPSSPARIIRLGAQALSHLPRPPPSCRSCRPRPPLHPCPGRRPCRLRGPRPSPRPCRGRCHAGRALRRTSRLRAARGLASAATPLPVKVENKSDAWVPRVSGRREGNDRS